MASAPSAPPKEAAAASSTLPEDDDLANESSIAKELQALGCLYTYLGVAKDADTAAIKKAYYTKSRDCHPDRLQGKSEEEKVAAEAEFKRLGYVNKILSESRSREVYDLTGKVDHVFNMDKTDWRAYWDLEFPETDFADYESIKAAYIGSAEETADVLKIYKEAEGDFDAILEQVPFADSEERDQAVQAIIDKAIAEKQVPVFAAYKPNDEEAAKARAAKRKTEAEAATLAKEAMEQATNTLGDVFKVDGETASLIKSLAAEFAQDLLNRGLPCGAPPGREAESDDSDEEGEEEEDDEEGEEGEESSEEEGSEEEEGEEEGEEDAGNATAMLMQGVLEKFFTKMEERQKAAAPSPEKRVSSAATKETDTGVPSPNPFLAAPPAFLAPVKSSSSSAAAGFAAAFGRPSPELEPPSKKTKRSD